MDDSTVQTFDVVVIGGGILGSSVAYNILAKSPSMTVCVVEPDPTYEFASALRSSGGCRVQFSRPENIQMSLYSLEFIKSFEKNMVVGDRPAPVDWVQGGYLFLVPPHSIPLIESNVEIQRSLGCNVDLLSPGELKARFPSIYVDDIGAGAHTPDDGWCDPNGLLWGFRRKATDLGAVYIKDKVASAEVTGTSAKSVRLESGHQIKGEVFVNCGGAWSGLIAEMFGMTLPIVPMRRFEHYFTCGNPIEQLPYVKDLTRLAFRSEGNGFSGGLVDGNERRGFNFDVDHDYFENVVWPAVAHRFPPLEAAKCHRTWSGLYEVNELDGNPVIGAWNSRLKNLYTVAGFSGHGMMHSPAAGRGIAELVVDGSFQTIDLTQLGYERVEANEPYREVGIL
ncbi:NAD(P)/FAD-dependent oxidoreductase [Paraburkholderia caledonica]|uniref:Glycine/D-amino acid oxidase-like deaminating enzyme n=1 Tax=Paraburkholderia caledonica TaxID=134536 RepID=A0AB73IT90_9BURK|nr:glycine/D-amino acid oxidase-like deaminating enzyme [Paraburkholderia caledonica]